MSMEQWKIVGIKLKNENNDPGDNSENIYVEEMVSCPCLCKQCWSNLSRHPYESQVWGGSQEFH